MYAGVQQGQYQQGPNQGYQNVKTVTNIEISVSCRNLKDLDRLSKSDPMVKVALQNMQTAQWTVLGQTEVIQNNLNPDFSKTFLIPYYFEQQQPLCFDVFDYDNANKMDFIGRALTSVGNIMGAKNCTQIINLLDAKGKLAVGKLIARGEENTQTGKGKDNCFLQFKASNLEDKDFFSKSDPFLTFSKKREDNTWVKVHETEAVKSNLNPIWNPFRITAQQLGNGDFYRPIKIECYDYENSGRHEFIGQCETNLQEILQKPTLELKNPTKMNRANYRNSGVIAVIQAQCIHEASFLEYIEGNCSISFMVAIDFTASNGMPHNPSSLHYINPSQPNEYERAILSIGGILEQYDIDRMFPVWGFGASVAQGQPVSHCFPLTGNVQQPFVQGIQGILDIYRNNLQRLYFNGPTLFQPIISSSMQIAAQQWSSGQQQYHILLIITDGSIHDMRQTKSLIVDASELPLSIIIVGVGNSDFSSMQELDSDNKLLQDERGKRALRDIVQFVPFRKFQGNGQLLAQEVLAEVPAQLASFMSQKGIQPIPKVQIKMQDLTVAAPSVYSEPHPETFNLTQPMVSGIGNKFGLQASNQPGQQPQEQKAQIEIKQEASQPQVVQIYSGQQQNTQPEVLQVLQHQDVYQPTQPQEWQQIQPQPPQNFQQIQSQPIQIQQPPQPGPPIVQQPQQQGPPQAQYPYQQGQQIQQPFQQGPPQAQYPQQPGPLQVQQPFQQGPPQAQYPQQQGQQVQQPFQQGPPQAQYPQQPGPLQAQYQPGQPQMYQPFQPSPLQAQNPYQPGPPQAQLPYQPGPQPTYQPYQPGIPQPVPYYQQQVYPGGYIPPGNQYQPGSAYQPSPIQYSQYQSGQGQQGQYQAKGYDPQNRYFQPFTFLIRSKQSQFCQKSLEFKLASIL